MIDSHKRGRVIWLSHVIAIGMFICVSATRANELKYFAVVKLGYGINQADFNNDGVDDAIILARRENFNAHSFDVVTLYSQRTPDGATLKRWNIVTIFNKNKEQLTLKVSGGADCILYDFRLLKPTTGVHALLILANRKLSKSYFEENAVNFDYYELRYNSKGEIGFPVAYFKYLKTVQAKKKYCDVNKAFRSELGLENYRSDQ